MGGFFGVVSKKDAVIDCFYGTDYHSHLGTRRAGMAVWNKDTGFEKEIHNISDAPFRTKFAQSLSQLKGNSLIGSISDSDPQPILVRSRHGVFAIATVGHLNNSQDLMKHVLENNGQYTTANRGVVGTTELIASLIAQKNTLVEGIQHVHEVIEGSMTILILREGDELIVARDKLGRLPVNVGKSCDGFAVSLEDFAFEKLGYTFYRELGPAEIISLTPEKYTVLAPAKKEKRMCSFLWNYYGYPTSNYEGVNVEIMRNRNGMILAQNDKKSGFDASQLDSVSGVPDSGTPHAIGYANESSVKFSRPFIKYTPTWPRSYMLDSQREREKIARMKMSPVNDLIKNKKILLIDDSIVRGTQIGETVDFLYSQGAKEVHMRSACPPMMFACKYLNFSRNTSNMELLTRRLIVELEGEQGLEHIDEYIDSSTQRYKNLVKAICEKYNFSTFKYQTLEGLLEAIGVDKCGLCTYCWNGKE